MNHISTIPDLLDDPAFKGIPLDPAIRDRVRARSARATEKAFQRQGYINIEDLRRPSARDDE